MSIVKKLSMATAGAAFIALGVGTTAPATAASLDFSFTTESGGTGSFTLDTDTAPDPNPALLGPAGGPFEEGGTVYTSAISNFSVSTPDVNLSGVTADFYIDPVLDFGDVFGIPDIRAVVSSVAFPVGCLTATDFACPVDVPIAYAGNVSELPVLSDDPRSYSLAFDIATIDTQTGDLLTSDLITESQVVPEPGSVLGTLAVGIGGAGLLLKRQMNRKKAAIRS